MGASAPLLGYGITADDTRSHSVPFFPLADTKFTFPLILHITSLSSVLDSPYPKPRHFLYSLLLSSTAKCLLAARVTHKTSKIAKLLVSGIRILFFEIS